MKITISRIALILAFICNINFSSQAQVLPNTTGVKLFCSSGTMDLGNPPANSTWEVAYSATATTTPSAGVALIGNTITGTELKTGYYYIMTKGTAAGACISAAQEIPVYLLSPLSVDFSGYELCVENIAGATLTGTVTSPDANTTSFAYQWYTVSGGTETVIPGETNATYTPNLTASSTTTYRLKAGYLIGGNKYCSSTQDHSINILATPTAPTITITPSSETW